VVERHAPTGETPRPLGQHSLRGSRLAEALVRSADVSPSDFVVEIGAGTGTLTEALASRAKTVVALEVDPRFAAQLAQRFSDRIAGRTLEVVSVDALRFAWPGEPFRAFGNIPFAMTTDLLRSLLDAPSLVRADLIVQWEVAVKRAVPKPRNLLNVSWGTLVDVRGRPAPGTALLPADAKRRRRGAEDRTPPRSVAARGETRGISSIREAGV
jgi:23S rRNA (adenine-N6)-dimethyltransferase